MCQSSQLCILVIHGVRDGNPHRWPREYCKVFKILLVLLAFSLHNSLIRQPFLAVTSWWMRVQTSRGTAMRCNSKLDPVKVSRVRPFNILSFIWICVDVASTHSGPISYFCKSCCPSLSWIVSMICCRSVFCSVIVGKDFRFSFFVVLHLKRAIILFCAFAIDHLLWTFGPW